MEKAPPIILWLDAAVAATAAEALQDMTEQIRAWSLAFFSVEQHGVWSNKRGVARQGVWSNKRGMEQ